MEKNCAICLHEMTNPICSDCYSKQVSIWLAANGTAKKVIEEVLASARGKINRFISTNEERCILCNRAELSICAHCFFVMVSKILEKKRFPEYAVLDFNHIFSYIK